VVSSLFVVSIFVAKITATLTVNELRSSIESVSDLHGKRVGTTSGSTSASYLTNEAVSFTEFANIEELFKALEGGKLHAVVHDAPVLSYYAKNEGKGLVKLTGSIFRPEKYGIVLPEGSPLREPINRALLRLREDGTYRSLLTKWFGESYQ
jgi:polar amino acid transport system substrate-binding protein